MRSDYLEKIQVTKGVAFRESSFFKRAVLLGEPIIVTPKERFNSLCLSLYEGYRQSLTVNIRNLALERKVFGAVIRSLLKGYRLCRAVRLSLTTAHLNKKLPQKRVIRVIKSLEKMGLITIVKGRSIKNPFTGKVTKTEQTRIIPTEELARIFELNSSIKIILPKPDIQDLVEIRDKLDLESRGSTFPGEGSTFPGEGSTFIGESLLKSKDENAFLEEYILFNSKRFITRYNQFLQSQDFSLNSIMFKPQLYRVFNGSVKENGRFYEPFFQNLSKEIRLATKINESTVVELDFKALHPSMLYHLKGMAVKDDPYLCIERLGFTRSEAKLIFLIVVNAKSEDSAFMAVFGKLKKKQLPSLNQVLGGKISKAKLINKVFNPVRECLADIGEFLFADLGNHLQRLDSEIMKGILEECLIERIPALPVHDSLVCERTKKKVVSDIMVKAYEDLIGFKPLIT